MSLQGALICTVAHERMQLEFPFRSWMHLLLGYVSLFGVEENVIRPRWSAANDILSSFCSLSIFLFTPSIPSFTSIPLPVSSPISSCSFKRAVRAAGLKQTSLRGRHPSGREAASARQQLNSVPTKFSPQCHLVERASSQVNSVWGMQSSIIIYNKPFNVTKQHQSHISYPELPEL